MRIVTVILGLLGLGAPLVASAAAPQTETAHDYLIHTWQTEQGLPQNWVSSIAQTPDGYLWVGTRYGGVARFDGVRFVPFNQQNTSELQDVQVEHLDVDKTGRLWIIMGNESVTAFRDGRFELFRRPRSSPRLRLDHALVTRTNGVLFAGELPYLATLDSSTAINQWRAFDPRPVLIPDARSFIADRAGTAWFITQDKRLVRFADNHFDVITAGLPESAAVAVAVNATGQPWVATRHHLAWWDGNGFINCTPTNGVPMENILELSFSGDGGLWVLEKKRLRKLIDNEWKLEIDAPDLLDSITSGTFSLHGDAQGNAWLVANGRGLLHCKADGTLHFLTEKSGLPSRFITCWFQDAEGDIWIGMHGGGLSRIREPLFRAFGPAEGLAEKVVSSASVSANGELWVGTMSGTLAHLQSGKFVSVPLTAPADNPNESITVIPSGAGGVWVGSLNHGVRLFRDGKFSIPPTPWQTVRVMFRDSHDHLWVGGLVNLFRLSDGQYKTFGAGDGFVDSHAIGAIAEDNDGAIWIGTGPGELWKYTDGKFSRFTPPPEWPAVRFSAVLPDTNGVVWVGTLGGGLLRFSHGKFTRCLSVDGLPDDNVPQLLDSHDGYLWGGTYAGIFRASKADLEAVADGRMPRLPCRVYGEYDGLPALECSSGFQPSCWRSEDGQLWFSTVNGVASVDPLKIVSNRIPPTVIIEDMSVDGRQMDIPPQAGNPGENTGRVPPLKILPGQHYIQFRFTGLSFTAPDGVRFRVRLEGGDNRWQATGGQRQIGYGPLSPGRYRFHVTACNNDGVWNEEGDTMAFEVLPYFWQTWWFRAGIGIAALSIMGLSAAQIQRRRYRHRLELAERQREMERERTRIARDLHDDLGTSLTQISMLSALANRETTSAAEAKDLVQQVRGRAREMVIALDEIVWAVNPKNDSLPGLVSYLGHFAEEFYRAAGIRFRLDIPAELPAASLSAELRHHLFLAFKEAVNNTARHSGGTQVLVRVEMLPGEAVIHVEDNGRGFESASTSGTGNGLANMRRRMEQIGGRAELRSTPGSGTMVSFHVPLESLKSI